MCIRYYLETNSIYSLVNKLDAIAKYDNVYISVLGIQEIISAIYDRSNFKRSMSAISKIKKSGISTCSYLPIECIAMSFKLDFSKFELIIERKEELWKRASVLTESTTFEEYEDKLYKMGININTILQDEEKTEVFNRINFCDIVHNDSVQFRERKKTQRETPQYNEINLDDLSIDDSVEGQKKSRVEAIRPTLINFLDNCKLTYNEDYIKDLCGNYNDELTTFLLGCLLYNYEKVKDGGKAGRNDFIDLQHLLYLRNENDFIVSDDKIFNKATIFNHKIGVDEFKKIFKLLQDD